MARLPLTLEYGNEARKGKKSRGEGEEEEVEGQGQGSWAFQWYRSEVYGWT